MEIKLNFVLTTAHENEEINVVFFLYTETKALLKVICAKRDEKIQARV